MYWLPPPEFTLMVVLVEPEVTLVVDCVISIAFTIGEFARPLVNWMATWPLVTVTGKVSSSAVKPPVVAKMRSCWHRGAVNRPR